MKKLMEVYGTEEGLIFKQIKKTYVLFCGIDREEDTQVVKPSTPMEAANLLIDFFEGELELSFEPTTQHSEKSAYTKVTNKFIFTFRNGGK
jgi:hypothetical protein